MSPEAQRIAIAEACGWTKCEHVASINLTKGIPPANNPPKYSTYENGMAQLPDYLNDLNAMHEAEKMLTNLVDQLTYLYKLSPVKSEWTLATATARQRASAYLRTIGKWEGEDER